MRAPGEEREVDRYELCERVVLRLAELIRTMDPSWDVEWELTCRQALVVHDELSLLWRMLRKDRLRYDPRLP